MKHTILSILVMLFSIASYVAFRVHGHSPNHLSEKIKPLLDGNTYHHHQGDGTSGWAGITSFVCALVGAGFCAVIFGAIGLGRKRRQKGLAIAGIVIGTIETIIYIALIVTLLAT